MEPSSNHHRVSLQPLQGKQLPMVSKWKYKYLGVIGKYIEILGAN